MPELSRFFGIIIRMYMEAGGPHHLPHFHAYYQDDVAVVRVDPIEIVAGNLPRRQRRLVEAWAELHQEELIADWERFRGARPRFRSPRWSERTCSIRSIVSVASGLLATMCWV